MTKRASWLFVFCCGLFAQDTFVDGTAIDAASGRPLAGVHVRVITIGAVGNIGSYGASSDRDGHFSIAGIRPGTYLYFGEKTGYVSLRKGGSTAAVPFATITVKPGDKLRGIRLEMSPRSTISGRVLDEYGDPIQNASLQVTPISPDAPAAFSMTNSSAQTDDRGEFHIPVAGGRYHVKATVYPASRPNEIRTDGTAASVYTPTYYPSAASTDRAVPVEIAAGVEARGIDIRMGSANGSSPGVDGIVTGGPEGRPAAVYVYISESGNADRYSFFQYAPLTEGRFRIGGLRPGRYRMLARMQFDGKTLQSQIVDFPDTAPPSGVELRLAPGAEVTASVAVSEGGKLPAGKRTIRLRPAGEGMMMLPAATAEVDADGGARIAGVFPGKYRVAVQPMPEGMYIRAVDLDGTVGDELDLTRGGGRLKVTLGTNAAQISGSVVEKDGTRLANTLGAVFLIRDKEKAEVGDEDSVSRLGADGSYGFKGLRPGKYWLLGIDMLRSGEFNSPEAMKKYAALAEEVEVQEGERLRKDVRVVTKEMLDAKPKQ